MTIKLSNTQVYQAFDAVQMLLNNNTIPIRGRLKLRALARVLKSHHEDVEQERFRLLDEYSEKDEDGKVKFADEAKTAVKVQPEFQQKYAELLRAEVDSIPQVPVSELGELAGVPGAVLFNLHDALLDDLTTQEDAPPSNTTKPIAATKRRERR